MNYSDRLIIWIKSRNIFLNIERWIYFTVCPPPLSSKMTEWRPSDVRMCTHVYECRGSVLATRAYVVLPLSISVLVFHVDITKCFFFYIILLQVLEEETPLVLLPPTTSYATPKPIQEHKNLPCIYERMVSLVSNLYVPRSIFVLQYSSLDSLNIFIFYILFFR